MQIGQAVNITTEEGVRNIIPGILTGVTLLLVIVLIILWTGFLISIIATHAKLWIWGAAILGAVVIKILISKVPWETRMTRLRVILPKRQPTQTKLTVMPQERPQRLATNII